MLRFLHTADIHFDTPFSARFSQEKATIRRREMMETFNGIIEKASDKEFLFISGDLFDGGYASRETLSFLNRSFSSIPNTKIMIVAGNHDPLTDDSPYKKIKWSENVYIFGKEYEYIDFPNHKIRIHGVSFGEKHVNRPMVSKLDIKEEFANLLLIHGEVVSEGGDSDYNPIYKSFIENCGVEYVALGHIHKHMGIERIGKTYFAYPGIPEGRGFDEDGEKGYIEGEIEKDIVNCRWVVSCARRFEHMNIDVSGTGDFLEILERVEKAVQNADTRNIYKIRLVGKADPSIIRVDMIEEHLKKSVFYIEVTNETRRDYPIEEMMKDDGIKGEFIRCMMDKISQMPEEEKEIGIRALEIGIEAMEGGRLSW